MADAIEKVTVSGYGLTLSKIVWRRFRRPMPGLVERILEANPGLAAKGEILPLGTAFDLIVPAEDPTDAARPVIRLWGTSA